MSAAEKISPSHIPDSIAPGTLRHSVLLAARCFKATWAEMGKLLVRVKDEGLFTEWGYDSFDTYALKELHIRKSTADKLTRSFGFLQKHEPRIVEAEDFPARAPAFEV